MIDFVNLTEMILGPIPPETPSPTIVDNVPFFNIANTIIDFHQLKVVQCAELLIFNLKLTL